ncbi:casein kinase 2 regulatory subunit, partial [Dispira parvispora]
MSLLLGDDPNEPFDYNEDYEEFYDDSDGGTETLSWISWFCSYSGHEYFCEVAEEYIEDEFNLTGLRQMVPHYNYALETILDLEEDVDEESPELPDMQEVEASAERLYGLIHARYIISRQGLQQMAEKYINGHFGSCPRYMCKNTYTVPCGTTNAVGLDSVKLFCPNCKDIYAPASTRFNTVDGAYFGTTFPHMFFMSFPEYGMMDITQER